MSARTISWSDARLASTTSNRRAADLTDGGLVNPRRSELRFMHRCWRFATTAATSLVRSTGAFCLIYRTGPLGTTMTAFESLKQFKFWKCGKYSKNRATVELRFAILFIVLFLFGCFVKKLTFTVSATVRRNKVFKAAAGLQQTTGF